MAHDLEKRVGDHLLENRDLWEFLSRRVKPAGFGPRFNRIAVGFAQLIALIAFARCLGCCSHRY